VNSRPILRAGSRFEKEMATKTPSKLLGVSFAVAAVMATACGDEASILRPEGRLDFEPDRPTLMPGEESTEYTGTDPFVLEAQATHRTGLELHRNVITRTCGPTGGVCHNQKEYPDLHTPSNLLAAVNAPCNVQSGDYAAVFNGCEPPGDKFLIDGQTQAAEIGYVEFVAAATEGEEGEAEVRPGLHVYVRQPLSAEYGDELWGEGHFLRKFAGNGGKLEELLYARFQTNWRLLDGGKHLYARVEEYQADQVNELLSVGIQQGDLNRDGVYGATETVPLALLKPGKPEESYLIGRLRGAIGPVGSESDIPGTRMPLANDPLSIADMLGLYCFVYGLPESMDGVLDLQSPIDYANCPYAADPESLNLLGKGATWLGRVQPLLEANCGGCHGGTEPQAGFDLVSDGVYERLLLPSTQNPAMPFITPGDPTSSYLWLKLVAVSGDGTITGFPMPIDPLEGTRKLSEGALADIETWIMNGALAED
jgi:hypothetical protein